MPSRCLQTLLTDLIDYAGLFPPARLSMQASAEAYARARMGEYAWMLGRFVCPASRLKEFTAAAAPLLPGTFATSGYREHAEQEPWRLSVLIDAAGSETFERDLQAIEAFNQHHSAEDRGLALVDMVELKPPSAAAIDSVLDELPEELFPFFEIPTGKEAPGGDPRGLIAALSGEQAAAKIRTGGITPNLIPSSRDVAEFLAACCAADVPFKATAGLHHPVRSELPLDSTPDAPRGLMHGFLNLFTAAALMRLGDIDAAEAEHVLDDRNECSFRFNECVVAWRDQNAECTELALVRETFALSFGSCSFDEPVEDLKKMELL